MSELDIIADTAADYFTGSTAVREVFAEKVIANLAKAGLVIRSEVVDGRP